MEGTIRLVRATVYASALLCGLGRSPAWAAEILLDTSTPGATYDSVLDGFPGIAPLDGTGDAGGNALAVGLKDGVTEERAILELPLAALGGIGAAKISSAVLTFNVDDVLSTFGPGTDFDGTAAERIAVATYAGDGAVGLDDFGKGSLAGAVDTGETITDATLATTGPVRFAVDITDAVRTLVAGGATHLGLVLSTDDSPTGTSIDDLGVGGSGPPGVDGASLPFVTITTTDSGPTPTPGGPTARPTPTRTPSPLPTNDLAAGLFTTVPDARGDQLAFYYDARSGFTTFLNVHNAGESSLTLSLALYGPDFGDPLEDVFTLAPGSTRTIDVAELRGRGLPAQYGIAFVTAVDGAGKPVVTRSLAGNFTVANLATSSAWGAAAAARTAVQLGASGVSMPAWGASIDGESVLLRAVRPDRLSLAVYYDPATLASPEQGGNQLIFLSFNDVPGDRYAAEAAVTRWALTARRNDGQPLSAPELDVLGVQVEHLESVLGEQASGAAGSILLSAGASGAYNRLVFFTESLGTFATGYLLPRVAP
ncbi:hypothetical protein K2Z84_03875 [Candidatus Binatia bacterium]|nr:hypothetical protein [Candidatus Binatia bacterium]